MRGENIEWIGARLPRPMGHVIVWFDVASTRFLGFFHEDQYDVGTALVKAMTPTRCPERVRVRSRRDAERIRACVGEVVEVVVDPLPELNDIFEMVVDMAQMASRV